MEKETNKITTVDAYIAQFPEETQVALNELRKTIKEAAPDAIEKIGYGMPAYNYHGSLIYYAANQKHIGLYPGSEPIEVFRDELKDYETSKGTIKIKNGEPLPINVVSKIVALRIEENLAKEEMKKAKKKMKAKKR